MYSKHKENEWRNEFEKSRFDLEGNCFVCGRQEYLHCEPTEVKCENNFEKIGLRLKIKMNRMIDES